MPAFSHRIVWAIDPFSEDLGLGKRTARAVAALARQRGSEVEPVYLVGRLAAAAELIPFPAIATQAEAELRLERLLRGVELPGLKPVRVIQAEGTGLRGQVDALVSYARESEADVVAVGTRARSGLERLLLGSFAETLLHHCDIPLFVINPSEATPAVIRNILFPTDFSAESRQAFDQVIELAKEIDARVTVYHAVQFDVAPWVDPGLVALPVWSEMLRETVEERREDADDWVKIAESRGAEATFVVEHTGVRAAADTILARAKRGTIIALAARSGAVAAALLGSVTRQVLRKSLVPVWVVHPTRPRRTAARPRRAA
ncbi:MAG TPA: universal stress protein [Bdellovibrionota bacterium]|nr:universal stress protein [Bdellovibrionota bacterium]